MRKLFKNKYELGYNAGWSEGFEVGRKKAVNEQRKVIIAALQKDIDKNKQHYSPGVLAGLHASISLIRKVK